MPLPLLIERHGGGLMLRDVLARLRCSKCGRRPHIMALVERPDHGTPGRSGAPEGWHIALDPQSI
jgi:hypothetical protein